MSAPAYFIFHTTIDDHEAIAPYLASAMATVTAFGGRRLLMGGPATAVEGEAPAGMTVILEFPGKAAAEAWYASPVYQEIIGIRLGASTSDAYLVEAVA
ncbi:DUF1330 domain-containing protein [Pleomorphomonas sp. PLEO]|uniref:DUF1330 domain-containing protein n=1 Tax=Pleomorphomonas sp. PLEO TaxID=3239306 RepID=UPI00351DACC5